jgi:exodeoxyribonuclease VII small subunit
MTKSSIANSANTIKALKTKITEMSFEEALARLEKIVETLSSDKINLEEMINLYQEGDILKQHCAKRLEEAKMKIEIITNKADVGNKEIDNNKSQD